MFGGRRRRAPQAAGSAPCAPAPAAPATPDVRRAPHPVRPDAADPKPADAPSGEAVHEATVTTDGGGEARLKVPVAAAGVHVVSVRGTFAAGRTVEASDLFIGAETQPELARVIADPRLLRAAAAQTGGVLLPPDAALADVPIRAPTVMRVRNRAFVELWSLPWVLAGLAALFGLEWWLRRRFGYL
jgi:hypothetical protein